MTDNFNIDDYIKEMDLSPELEEKARQCQNSSELMELAAENDVELPLDALEMVSGGCGGGKQTCPNPDCKSQNIKTESGAGGCCCTYCADCGRIISGTFGS